MRVLVTPMAAMAETSGPYGRAASLCQKLIKKGHKVAFCAAEDINYKEIENVKNFYAPVPSPFGMPQFIGKRMMKMGQRLNIQEKKQVKSFEQVLFFAGATAKKHFYNDVLAIRDAIHYYKPDVVYAEFRPAAIVAAKLENVKVATGYSFPVQPSFASNPEYSKGVRAFLQENNLPPVKSVLEIFDWADLKIVPSSHELEPMDGENIIFTGPFSTPSIHAIECPKDKILVYMGFGTISPHIMIENMMKLRTDCKIYVATKQVKPFQKDNMIVDERFDFGSLMPGAVAYINHGGQNSIMTGLMYGVPQIIYPGNIFERKYNAASVVNLGAGVTLAKNEFTAERIGKIMDAFKETPTYAANAKKAGENLLDLGGAGKAVEAIEKLVR